ncbi:phosphoglycerol geranylgeranyltransferase [Haladaptatus pallidirubidus]|uniref:Phosphoglycerol geranylgeranyltransferase n=1 Tax=Haladaptatus pallidirubidus TaxID=1008152 RepID=A0AAV3UJY1_9EURY|nr:putative phosphoglycerol geranylgeranyltransferase [Haladaptatus pallidirubidus]
MTGVWEQWDHVKKIDPAKTLHNRDSYAGIASTGTDAIILGGTTNVTESSVRSILDALVSVEIPVFVEPTYHPTKFHHDTLTGYLIPIVLNAGDRTWVTGAHHEWVRSTETIDWELTHTVAYIVLNSESSVATYTQAGCDLDVDDVVAYAELAEQILGQQIVYLEYSGTLGNSAIVAAARDALSSAQLFYGGGIHDYESACEMASVADTIVVDNVLHEAGIEAVEATVRGATDAHHES